MNRNSVPAGGSDQTVLLLDTVRKLGVDLVGFADLDSLTDMPLGVPREAAGFLDHFHGAVVMGVQFGKLGRHASGTEVALFLEKAALTVASLLEQRGNRVLIVHTDDEFDPVNRMGLLSLKVLAKAAGLGWQGRSLLIVSPTYGPVHRWIAVLTDMALPGGEPVPNQCGDCTICVDNCPADALRLVRFEDHPASREDVLDVSLCKGDDACTVCLAVCPRGQFPGDPVVPG